MNLLEILKNYWYVILIAFVLIGVVIYYFNYMSKTKPNKSEVESKKENTETKKESTTNIVSAGVKKVDSKNAVVSKGNTATTKKNVGKSSKTVTPSKPKTNSTPITKTTPKTNTTTIAKKENAPSKTIVAKESTVAKKTAIKATPTKSKNKKQTSGGAVAKKSTTEEVAKNINYRVVHEKESGTWAIKKSDTTRVIRRVKTKEEALEIVKSLGKNQGLNVVVHKRDGKFQSKK